MQLNLDYESRITFREQESYSVEWLARSLHLTCYLDTPPHPSNAGNKYPPYRGVMFVSSTMVSEEQGPEVDNFYIRSNYETCRRAVYKILRTLRKHGYLNERERPVQS